MSSFWCRKVSLSSITPVYEAITAKLRNEALWALLADGTAPERLIRMSTERNDVTRSWALECPQH